MTLPVRASADATRLLLSKMTARLSSRERILLLVASITGAVAAFYVGVDRPSEARQASLLQAVEQATLLSQRLATLDVVNENPTTLPDPRSLAVLVSETADERNVVLSRLSERGSGVELEIASLPFEVLVGWLHALMNEYGAIVEAVEITREIEPATVSARVSLSMPDVSQ